MLGEYHGCLYEILDLALFNFYFWVFDVPIITNLVPLTVAFHSLLALFFLYLLHSLTPPYTPSHSIRLYHQTLHSILHQPQFPSFSQGYILILTNCNVTRENYPSLMNSLRNILKIAIYPQPLADMAWVSHQRFK